MGQKDRSGGEGTLGQLREKLSRLMPRPGKFTCAVLGLAYARREEVNKSENCFNRPVVAVVVQGFKRSVMGGEEYRYGEGHCLVAGVDMPSSSQIIGASPEEPFLAISLDLDRSLIARLAAEVPAPPGSGAGSGKALSIVEVDPDVLDAFLRLVEMLDRPEQIPALAPLVVREIHTRLLLGPQGGYLRQITTHGTQSNQISRAITWLKDNYREPLQVDRLAQQVNMATSTFHRHFKEVTTLSPLQFHKRLRLYEAQRLMLAENANATSAGMAVGYESTTQFNREYKRLFGEPPRRDMSRLR